MEKNGKPITAEKTFTAKKADGTVKVSFTFGASDLSGKSLVAFEKLYIIKDKTEKEIVKHEDLNDKDQTVSIKDGEPDRKKKIPPAKKRTGHPRLGCRMLMLPSVC